MEEAGVPYAGIDGSIPTDAYTLAGPVVTVSLTKRI
jgi:hypothetical protein